MDDWPVIKENSKIADTKYIPDYFTSGVWANTDLADQIGLSGTSLYRPLFLLTLNIGYQLWGDSATGYHALNVLLHCINSLLVLFLITSLLSGTHNKSKANIAALLGAAIFATHPVHVESIAWVAGLTDPLVALFLLGGMLSYRQFSLTQKYLPGAIALFCYVAALLCKEIAILFPLLLIAHDKFLENKFYLKRYLPYGLLFILYFVVRNAALEQSTEEIRFNINQWPILLEFITHYSQLLFLPWPLEYYYDKPTTTFFNIIIGTGITLTALFFLPQAYRKQHPLFIFSLIWIVATLMPALPIALIKEPVFAIRVLYLPSAGVSLFIAWLYINSKANIQHWVVVTSTVTILAFIPISIIETNDWKNDTIFYEQAIKTSPQSFKPYGGLAKAYERNNNHLKTIEFSLQAAALAHKKSDQLSFLENAARLYGVNGDIQNSEHYYRKIIDQAPQRSSAWVGLGNNALARQDLKQAENFYHKAFQADPGNLVASYNLAIVYKSLGNTEQAMYFQRITQQLQNKH